MKPPSTNPGSIATFILLLAAFSFPQSSLGTESRISSISFDTDPALSAEITAELIGAPGSTQAYVYRIRVSNSGSTAYSCTGQIRFRSVSTLQIEGSSGVSDMAEVGPFGQDVEIVAAQQTFSLNAPVYHDPQGSDDSVSCAPAEDEEQQSSGGTNTGTGGTSSSGSGAEGGLQIVNRYGSEVSFSSQTVTMTLDELRNSSDRYTGSLRMELWVTASPYSGGSISGYRVATSQLDGLPPRSSYFNVSRIVPVSQWPPEGNYYMNLLVTEYTQACGSADGFCTSTYGATDAWGFWPEAGGNTGGAAGSGNSGGDGGTQLTGQYSYSVDLASSTVRLTADRLENSSTATTGTLRLELWLTGTPYSGGSISGYRLATHQLHGSTNGQLPPNSFFSDLDHTVGISGMPPAGNYYVTLIVSEFDSGRCGSSDNFCIETYGNFSGTLEWPSLSDAVEITGAASSTVDLDNSTVFFSVERLENLSLKQTTGSLRLELWATESQYTGGTISGYKVGEYRIAGNTNGQLPPQSWFSDLSATVSISSLPPAGEYFKTLIVTEYTTSCGSTDGFCVESFMPLDSLTISDNSGQGSGGTAGGSTGSTNNSGTTSTQGGGGGGGGGGTFGPWSGLLLAGLWFALRRRATRTPDPL